MICRVLGFEIDGQMCRSCSMCQGKHVPKTPTERVKEKPCECGKMFTPASNRQQRCSECGKLNEAKGNRERQARFKKHKKELSNEET
jgi:hypothetical protein